MPAQQGDVQPGVLGIDEGGQVGNAGRNPGHVVVQFHALFHVVRFKLAGLVFPRFAKVGVDEGLERAWVALRFQKLHGQVKPARAQPDERV